MPYILCGGHTITTNNDGTFYINVQSPNGKKADYAAYTIGPFGTGFGQAGEYTAQRWDTSDVNHLSIRQHGSWRGAPHALPLPPVEHQRQPLVREGRDIRKLDRNLEQAIAFPNPDRSADAD